MNSTPDRGRDKLRPYLIAGDSESGYRLTLRETNFNSQNYPIVTATPVGETFETAAAARAYAKENFGAIAGEFEVPALARKKVAAKAGRK